MAVVVAVVMVMVMVVMVAMVVMEMVMVVKRQTADGDGGQRQTADGAHALPLSAHSQGLAGDAPVSPLTGPSCEMPVTCRSQGARKGPRKCALPGGKKGSARNRRKKS